MAEGRVSRIDPEEIEARRHKDTSVSGTVNTHKDKTDSSSDNNDNKELGTVLKGLKKMGQLGADDVDSVQSGPSGKRDSGTGTVSAPTGGARDQHDAARVGRVLPKDDEEDIKQNASSSSSGGGADGVKEKKSSGSEGDDKSGDKPGDKKDGDKGKDDKKKKVGVPGSADAVTKGIKEAAGKASQALESSHPIAYRAAKIAGKPFGGIANSVGKLLPTGFAPHAMFLKAAVFVGKQLKVGQKVAKGIVGTGLIVFLLICGLVLGSLFGGGGGTALLFDDEDEGDSDDGGCSVEIDSVGVTALAFSQEEGERAEHIYNFFKELGFNDEQILGILTNWHAESGNDPSAIQNVHDEPGAIGPKKQSIIDRGFTNNSGELTGIGLGQWTYERNQAMRDYQESHGNEWYDFDGELQFTVDMSDEGDSMAGWVMTDYLMATDLSGEECVKKWCIEWERPKDKYATAERRVSNHAPVMAAAMTNFSGGGDDAASEAAKAVAETNVNLGILGGAMAGLKNSAGSSITSDSNCYAPGSLTAYSNDTLADAAVSYAYLTKEEGVGNNGTPLYQQLHECIFPGDTWFMSCDRGVAVAVRWTGTDTDYPAGNCAVQYAHLVADADHWKEVDGWNGDVANLSPGDVLIAVGVPGVHNHTTMYVGYESVFAKWGDQATQYYNVDSDLTVSASKDERSPGVGFMSSNEKKHFLVYRNVKRSDGVNPYENAASGVAVEDVVVRQDQKLK